MKKELKVWLIVDPKTEKFRVISIKVKDLKKKLKHTEIPIEVTLHIDVPETPILKASGEIKLSQLEISKMVLSEFEDEEEETK